MIVLLSALFPWFVLLALKYRVGYIHAVFLFLSFQAIAVYNVGNSSGDTYPFYIFISGNLSILVGLWIGKVVYGKRGAVLPDRSLGNKNKGKVSFFIWFVLFMVVYHYVVGGVPLFSSNVVIDRFNNDSSGLFGLPGRVNLFGTFFAFFLASLSYFYSRGELGKRKLILSLSLLFLSLVFAGNKGNFVQFIVAIMVVLPYAYWSENSLELRKKIRFRHLAFSGGGVILFFSIVSMVHINAGDATYSGVYEALERRIMEISGKAFYVTATSVLEVEGVGYGSYFFNDMSFFVGNFLGEGFSQHSTINIVSSYVTGRDIDSGLFLVPVTITLHGYSLLEFGVFGPALIGLAIGVVMSWLYYYPYKSKNITSSVMVLYLQIMIFWVVTKGNVGYYVPNMLIMLALFYFILCFYNSVYRALRA